MNKTLYIILLAFIFMPLQAWSETDPSHKGPAHVEVELPTTDIDLSPESIERGKKVYLTMCQVCHGLKFWRGGKEYPNGLKAFLNPKAAAESFGAVPPDLSLMAKARGKRLNGSLYIYQLLTTYYTDEDGTMKNRAFAKWTHSEGVTSMPPAIPMTDPELHQKSKDVAAFLYDVAEPTAKERKGLGRYVLLYMFILTGFLYAYNKKVWRGVKK